MNEKLNAVLIYLQLLLIRQFAGKGIKNIEDILKEKKVVSNSEALRLDLTELQEQFKEMVLKVT